MRRRATGAVIVAVGVTAGGPIGGRVGVGVARGDEVAGPAATGGATTLTARSRAPSLAVPLPRGGSYERALEAVRQEQYRRAVELWNASVGELLQAADEGRIDAPRARTLALQAELLAAWARKVADLARDPPRTARPIDVHLEEALALHRLYLASTAWLGRPDPVLFARADAAYRLALGDDRGRSWPRARLGHAALLASAGRRAEAAAEFARLPPLAELPELGDLFAHYFAVTGQRARAFRALSDLRDALPDWPAARVQLRVGNELDPLRDDPRFVRLLGDDE